MDRQISVDPRRLAYPAFMLPLAALTAYFALVDPYSQIVIPGVPAGFINGTFVRSALMLEAFVMLSLYQRGLKRTLLTVAFFYGVSSVVFESIYFAHLGLFWYTVIFANIDSNTLPGWAFKQIWGLLAIAVLIGLRRFPVMDRKSLVISIAYFGQFLFWLFVVGFPWLQYMGGEAAIPRLFIPQLMETVNVALALVWFYVVVRL